MSTSARAMTDQAWVGRLVADLRALGLQPGSVVMAHVSMRRVGGRAEELVEALDRAVAPGGAVLVNVGASEAHGPFEARQTPSDPDVGVFAEVFRTTPGTEVGDHPEGRLAARGEGAAALVGDVPWDHYYGPGSPLERLVQRGGAVLRLGADVDTVTLYHYAEYLVRLPHKREVVRTPQLLLADGSVAQRSLVCLDDSDGIVEWPGPDYFGLLLADHLARRRVPAGMVGGAHAELLDARAAVDDAVAWMAAHLADPAHAADTRHAGGPGRG